MIELIRDDITEKLKAILGDNFTSSIKTCELSYNLPVGTNEEINNLISILRNVFLEEKRQSAVYYIKSMRQIFVVYQMCYFQYTDTDSMNKIKKISSKLIPSTGLWPIHFRESIARTPYFQAFAFSQTFYYTFFTPFLQLPTSHLLTNHPLHDNTNPSSFSKNYALTVFVKSLDASLVQCRSLQKYALNNAV